jgi:hypothetical protein
MSLSNDELLTLYNSGQSCRAIAKLECCRAINISQRLQGIGVNVHLNRAFRSNAQRKGKPNQFNTSVADSLRNNISVTDWAYMAGLFDGEGCLSTQKKGYYKWNYRLTISQNGTAIHEWVQATIGCGLIKPASTKKSKHKNHYQFQLCKQKQIYEFLIGILPFCKIKRQKVTGAIEDMETKYCWASSVDSAAA